MHSKHGSLESIILNALWNLESMNIYTNSVKDVYNLLSSYGDKRAYTTVKTVMDRLAQKKILLRYKQGKKFFYRTVYSNREIIEKSLVEISSRYCSSDIKQLLDILTEMTHEECLVRA